MASAHHRNDTGFSEMQNGIRETFDHLNVSMNAGTFGHHRRNSKSKLQAPFGISAEVRKRKGMGSRTSNRNANLSGSHQVDSLSHAAGAGSGNHPGGLSQNMSSANFAQGMIGTTQGSSLAQHHQHAHQRKKLPIGFLVQ